MKFTLHPVAKLELDEAVSYYEEQRPGLGFEFAEEVYGTPFSASFSSQELGERCR